MQMIFLMRACIVLICWFGLCGSALASGWQKLEGGVLKYETEIRGATAPIKVWFYLPAVRKGKIPCVFIAPAGSAMFHGMRLTDGDTVEHLPYAKNGFAVVAYEIEGPLAENASSAQMVVAAKAFMASKGGVVDGQNAISAALESIKDLDHARLFAAGHSSAGTTALSLAARDPRIKACAAYAPDVDVADSIGQLSAGFNKLIPGFSSFVSSFSPDKNTTALRCPVLLFFASDDDVVSPAILRAYSQRLGATNKSLKVVTVSNGGHYDSMIRQGIPGAIQFFKGF